MKKKLLFALPIVILLFTNPNVHSFKEYKGRATYNGLHRDYQFFLASVYSTYDETYLGILGNFFLISSHSEMTDISPDSIYIDSSYIDSSIATLDTLPKIHRNKKEGISYAIYRIDSLAKDSLRKAKNKK